MTEQEIRDYIKKENRKVELMARDMSQIIMWDGPNPNKKGVCDFCTEIYEFPLEVVEAIYDELYDLHKGLWKYIAEKIREDAK